MIAINSLATGGTQRFISVLTPYLSEQKKLDLHLVLFGREPKIHFELPPGISIHRPKTVFKNNLRLLYTLGRLLYLRRTIRRIDPHAVLSFGEYWNNLVLIALKGTSIPVFVSDRSQPGKELGRLHNKLRDRLYPKAAGYMAQTGYAAELAARKQWNSNIRVIWNPVKGINPAPGHIRREKIILSVGRILATKNFDRLIKVFLEINDPEWTLIIVGGDHGKQRLFQALKDQVSASNAEDRVLLPGYQSNVEDYYRRSQIFAFMSSSEGFPNAILEAMSAQLPVVAFEYNPGIRDLVRDEQNGFLVPLDEDELFRQKLNQLMMDPDLRQRLALEGMQTAREFGLESIGESLIDFIYKSGDGPAPKPLNHLP